MPVLTINAQPAGGVIVGVPELPCAVIDATMTSLASVPVGLLMLSDVALLAVPLLALAAPWNPMMNAPGQVSATSQSFAAARHTAPAFPAACWQLVLVPLHVSVVQGSPSSRHVAPAFPAGCVQLALVPLHTSVVQGLPSSVQVVAADFLASVGQAVLTPSQLSATSHSPAAARQTVPAVLMTSGGQVALDPVQFSAASHTSTAARQTVLDDLKPSAGQAALDPVQFSATSQGPADVRQTVPLGWKPSGGQVALDPVQVSATSQESAGGRERRIARTGSEPVVALRLDADGADQQLDGLRDRSGRPRGRCGARVRGGGGLVERSGGGEAGELVDADRLGRDARERDGNDL